MVRAVLASLVLAGLFAGCAGALPVVTAGDAARSGVGLAELQQGRSLVAAKCSSCHRTPQPTEHKTVEWPKMIDEMAQRANVVGSERQAIRDYLVTMATR
jgi:nitrate/TMAO reductase-like tetraheme cytochrome c subunit